LGAEGIAVTKKILSRVQTGKLGWVGSVALLLTSTLLISQMERALHRVWHTQSRRRLIARVVAHWVVLASMPFVLAALIAITEHKEIGYAAAVGAISGDKVVWLRSANFLADDVTGRSERTLSGVERLRAMLEAGLPPGVKFLLTATGIDKRRAFWKALEKVAEVQVHDRIDTSREGWQDQVGSLVNARAKELGLKFEPAAMELFVMLAGEATQLVAAMREPRRAYPRGVSLIAILRREAGAIEPRQRPADVAADLHDPLTVSRGG
jgi:hypothetical protein